MLLDMGAWNPDKSNPILSMNTLQKWLSALVDGINECLCNIDEGNLNDGFYQTLNATKVVAQTVISNTVITQNLYATYGDIAELTCDRLLTANKVDRYKNRDTSEINYIWIQDKSIKFMTGTVEMNEETPITAQHTDRDGNLLYWKDADLQSMGTDVTAFPVTVYEYTEMCKASISFSKDESGYYVPMITLGAGTGVNNNAKAFIYKGVSGLYLDYYSNGGELRRVLLNDNGIFLTPYKLENIDFYDNGFSAKYSGETISYTWTKDSSGLITQLATADGDTIPVTWHSGNM